MTPNNFQQYDDILAQENIINAISLESEINKIKHQLFTDFLFHIYFSFLCIYLGYTVKNELILILENISI